MRQSKVIGITGSIAAGKSTVCRYLEERYGIYRLDADQVGHEMIERPNIVKELTNAFGTAILDTAGRIDRRALGGMVFTDPEKLALLNSITHPAICREIEERIRSRRDPLILREAIELLRTPLKALAGEIWVVWAEDTVRVRRIMARQGLSEAEAWDRVRGQWPQENYKKAADVLIDGGQPLEEMYRFLDRLMEDNRGDSN